MSILWTIIIGFVAGVIAKFIMPGDNEPTGFILTAILGIVGAFVATYLGQALGWYERARCQTDRRRSGGNYCPGDLWRSSWTPTSDLADLLGLFPRVLF